MNRLASLAEKLISANGRDMVAHLRSDTPTNADQPWRGSSSGLDVPIRAVVAELERTSENYERIAAGFKQLLVAAGAQDESLEESYSVTDGDTTWVVDKASLLQPGSVRILYLLDVRK